MKVSIVRGGGIAGLVTVITVDSASLAPEVTAELRARVERAGLSGAPERQAPPEGRPDRFDYELTVEDGGRVLATRAREGDLPGPLRALISYVTSRPERQERVGPPG
ncbi:protealysin inhibitor emfourin [Streptosporangium sp. NPDC002721]|uniref:protealysin inhibitor emfourin n=1 Tax=Streptosporangium sp. NPDC002721 TaxID=3366188 RepID=UPI0036AD6A05